MKSKKLVLMAVAVVVCITSNLYGTTTYFNDDAVIKDGDVYNNVVMAFSNATIEMTGGLVNNAFETYQASILNFRGGNIIGIVSLDSSIVNMWGGETASLEARGSSIVNIYGGTINGTGSPDYWWLSTWENARVNIYGGSVPVVESYDNSLITIYGTSFNYPAGLYLADSIDRVVGILASGEPINMQSRGAYDSGIMLVIVPEPATLLLLGLGGLFLRRKN